MARRLPTKEVATLASTTSWAGKAIPALAPRDRSPAA
jgi:hypothetical protein